MSVAFYNSGTSGALCLVLDILISKSCKLFSPLTNMLGNERGILQRLA